MAHRTSVGEQQRQASQASLLIGEIAEIRQRADRVSANAFEKPDQFLGVLRTHAAVVLDQDVNPPGLAVSRELLVGIGGGREVVRIHFARIAAY